jgi:hypothetical protein
MRTLKEALNVRIRCPDDKMRYDKFVKEIYESIGTDDTCKTCVDFKDGICKDHKGHYCIHNYFFEDRYIKCEEQ